jgi:hypothetical protein
MEKSRKCVLKTEKLPNISCMLKESAFHASNDLLPLSSITLRSNFPQIFGITLRSGVQVDFFPFCPPTS